MQMTFSGKRKKGQDKGGQEQLFELVYEVLVAHWQTGKGWDEPVHPCSLAKAFNACTHNM